MRKIPDQPFGSQYWPETLVELLQWKAEHHPDQVVFIYLKDGENEEVPITFSELDRRARVVAARLQKENGFGERALLLYPPGLEYIAAFFGCLYAGVIAVPAYPPRLNRPAPRIQAIVADAQARITLTNSEILASMEKRFEHTPDLAELEWIDTGILPDFLEIDWKYPEIDSQYMAFFQYTSGSTSTPKGVQLTHENLLHNLEQIRHAFWLTGDEVAVSWLPSYHDMGLIGTIMGTIYAGKCLIHLAPLDFLQRPLRWLNAISRYKACISGGPNFAYDLCVEKVKPEQLEALDLSGWKLAFSGAEPVRQESMKRFADTFAPSGFRYQSFYPCYGLAEATLFVSGGYGSGEIPTLTVEKSALEKDQIVEASPDDEGSQTLVGCGSPKLEQEILIVNPDTHERCAPNQVGEIWVKGKSVSQGYWKRPQENERTFGAYLASDNRGPFMRTGDLGFMRDGQLYITGRLKDLIIIRGGNHYPQDIELTVEKCHEAIQPAGGAAFSLDIEGEERLVIVQEVARQYRRANLDEVISAIRTAVSENHDLQVYAIVLIMPFTIPKTSSGKIQRHACKAAFLNNQLDAITEWRLPIGSALN